MSKILEMARNKRDYAVSIRRQIHSNPELPFEEFKTSALIKEELERMKITYKAVLETGIVAEVKGDLEGPVIALRADMDALQVLEPKGLEFASQNEGIMHACGHDAHTTTLLVAAGILNELKAELRGTVKFIFQPAEETVSGAPKMLQADPFFEDVEAVMGIHCIPELPVGKIAVHDGATFFAGEGFTIHVEGRSGHGANPSGAIDAIMPASAIVMNSHDIISSVLPSNEPGVLTICKFISGTRLSIIPAKATLEGTFRCYSTYARKTIEEALERIVENTAAAFQAKGSVEWGMYVPPIINDVELGKKIRKASALIVGEENIQEIEALTASDDFAYFAEKAPGYYLFVGCGDKDPAKRAPWHNEKFYLDEDYLPIAAAAYAQIAMDFADE